MDEIVGFGVWDYCFMNLMVGVGVDLVHHMVGVDFGTEWLGARSCFGWPNSWTWNFSLVDQMVGVRVDLGPKNRWK